MVEAVRSLAAREHLVEHLGGELAGERVLLARVEAPRAARYGPTARPRRRGRTAARARRRRWPPARRAAGAPRPTRTRRARPSTRSPGSSRDLPDEVRQARVALLRRRPVRRRRAAHGGATYAPRSSSPSSRPTDVGWFASPHRYSAANRKSPRPVAGEDPAGPVAAVRGGRQPDDRAPAHGVAEPRHRPAPVRLVARTRARFSRATCSRQATSRGQRATGDDLGVDLGERGHPLSIGRG